MILARIIRNLLLPFPDRILWPGTMAPSGKYHACHVMMDVDSGEWAVFDGDTLLTSRVHDFSTAMDNIHAALFRAALKFGFK